MVISDGQRQMKGYGSGGWWWTATATAANGGGRWWWTVLKVNGKRINWYKVRKIVLRRYKIEGEKIGTK